MNERADVRGRERSVRDEAIDWIGARNPKTI